MMFIDGKQKTEIHLNKTIRLHVQALWAYASWTMLTGLQATCTHAHRPSGHMHTCSQAFRPHAITCSKALRLHACFKPKRLLQASNQGNRPMRGYSMLSHKHGLLLFKDMFQIFWLSGSFCVATATSLAATHHAFSVHRAMAGSTDFGLVWEGMGFKLLEEGMDKAWLCALLQCKVCFETVQAAKDEIQSQEVSIKQKGQSLQQKAFEKCQLVSGANFFFLGHCIQVQRSCRTIRVEIQHLGQAKICQNGWIQKKRTVWKCTAGSLIGFHDPSDR